jgi:hypothetical protein
MRGYAKNVCRVEEITSYRDANKKDLPILFSEDSFEERKERLENLAKRGARFMRIGNTIFTITGLEDNVVEFHVVNGDARENYLVNLTTFFAFLKSRGIELAQTAIQDLRALGGLKLEDLPDYFMVYEVKSGPSQYEIDIDLTRFGSAS